MRLELTLRTWSEASLLTFPGSGPQRPRETSDRYFKLESLVTMEKNESMENLLESGELLFPITVNWVMRLPEQATTREGFGGR